MDQDDTEFLARLLETFRIEAEEHFEVLSNGLLELERDPDGDHLPQVETLFREAHSLKGAARAVELGDIESVCQAMESVLAAWKRSEIGPSTELFDTLNEAVDALRESSAHGRDSATAAEAMGGLIGRLLKLAEAGKSTEAPVPHKENAAPAGAVAGAPAPAPAAAAVSAPTAPVATAVRPEAPAAARTTPQPKGQPAQAAAGAVKAAAAEVSHQGDTIRVSLSRLTELMLRMEELITVKLVLRQRTGELNDLLTEFDVWKKRWQAVRAAMTGDAAARPVADVWLGEPPPENESLEARRRGGDKLVEYVNWNTEFVNDLAGRIARLTMTSENDQRSLGPLVEDLLDDVKTLVMLPFSSLSQAFPKMVRDLARAEGKAVDLTVSGGDIEIDRHVLETIKDPIVHILRNCVGHGIETPDVRAKRGKPVRGQVTISVRRVEGNKLSILVADDGGGIDIRGVRQVAGKVGARSQDQLNSLDDEHALALVFESGVSTNPIVTDVSGRGIGLAIVQEKVEQLGGSASVESTPGVGTTFELIVPATLASSRGVVVRVADRLFVLPTLHVDRVTRVDPRDIKTVENTDTVPLDGQAVAFAFLHDVLTLTRRPRSDDAALLPVVVLVSGNERIAFAVDWILGEQEVLVKTLGPQLESVRYVTGATVLESEKIALILHPPEVLRAAAHGTLQTTPIATVVEETARRKKKILVAEDSITSRTLLKNILETTGYEVRTVVDGLEALTALMEEDFDLLISDVEMPRMNGFDLTAKIRGDDKYAELPVMLVTSLESREDREKGVDVGANAYITKGSFDQTTLLETARRLM
jgi:two-component system chemotaxis sensor kinase CheA